MTASAQKKTDRQSAPETSTAQPPVPVRAPDLIAYYTLPMPKGQPAIVSIIGSGSALPNGEGYTLQFNLMHMTGGLLMPTDAGLIILRKTSKLETTLTQSPAPAAPPDLTAYYAPPTHQGQALPATEIGTGVALENGEGYTLNLKLMPVTSGILMPMTGAPIVLRKPPQEQKVR